MKEGNNEKRAGELLESLAEKVALGELGEFPLFGKIRECIVNDLNVLDSLDIFSRDRGIYVGFRISEVDNKIVDLIDEKSNKLYFKYRGDAEKFRDNLKKVYPDREFGCGLTESEKEISYL